MDDRLELIISISKNFKVLYVEDQKDVQKQTLKILKNFFNDITVANNGKEGFKKFKQKTFHIIFTDLEMPQMDGISLIQNIRESNKTIPIVIFSAYSNTEYFLKTINMGIDGYILKPYSFDQILETIGHIVLKLNMQTVNENNYVSLGYGFDWDINTQTLLKNKMPIKLTKNETKLFELLLFFKNSYVCNAKIEMFVFGSDSSNSKKIINLISRLRKKLGFDLFESNYGNGYRLILLDNKQY